MTPREPTELKYYHIEQDIGCGGYFVVWSFSRNSQRYPVAFRFTLWGARWLVHRLQRRVAYTETFDPIARIVHENAKGSPSGATEA